MSKVREHDALIEALRLAAAEPGEQRLYRSGKLPGLFASRSGAVGEAAAQAVRDGFVEVVRTEAKGKTTVEWVRIAPRGLAFLHEQESPLEVLRELRGLLQASQEALPGWLAEMRRALDAQAERLAEEARHWTRHLEALAIRVDEALARVAPPPPDGLGGVAWAGAALAYLDRRRASGAPGECSLPELFAALQADAADLSIPAFHDGLRRLGDRKAVRLLPYVGRFDDLPRPEFALVDGTELLYYVTR
jgi:hypothetical protein